MTKSFRRKQKRLRKQDKPHSPFCQSPSYWKRKVRDDERTKDILAS